METYNDITKYAKIWNVFCGWTKGRENMKKAQDFSSLEKPCASVSCMIFSL